MWRFFFFFFLRIIAVEGEGRRQDYAERDGYCDALSLSGVSPPALQEDWRPGDSWELSWLRQENQVFKKILLLAVLGLHCCEGFSPVVASGGYSSLQWVSFSLEWLPLLRSMCSGCTGFSSSAPGLQSAIVVVHGLSCSAACGIRDGTCFSRVGRWILYHWATKEAPRTRSLYAFSVVTESRCPRKGVILGKEALSS